MTFVFALAVMASTLHLALARCPGKTRANRDTLADRDIWLDDRGTHHCRRRLPLPPSSILVAACSVGTRIRAFQLSRLILGHRTTLGIYSFFSFFNFRLSFGLS